MASSLIRPDARNKRHRALRLEPLESRVVFAITAAEQYFVYRINYARDNPTKYQAEQNLSVDLSYVTPRAPLAIVDSLFQSSEAKVNDMAANNYFAHQSPAGVNANLLVRNNGYPLPQQLPAGGNSFWVFPDSGNSVESIAAGYSTVDVAFDALVVDQGINPPGHRNHLLGIDSLSALYRDIGVGYAFNASTTYRHYWAIHAAAVNVNQSSVTGVAYNDADGDGKMDLGEGLAGVTIQIPSLGLTTTTNAGGGWALPVANGSYQVQASGGGFTGSSSASATVAGSNVEVDFRSGVAGAQIGFEQAVVAQPALTLTLPASIAENGGVQAGTATITRQGSLTAAVTVTLSSSDPSELQPAASVIIPAGQASATFFLPAVDDTLLDGTQVVTLTASATGYTSAVKSLNVTDAETLAVTLSAAIAYEGGAAVTGTLRRSNTDTQQAVAVGMSSSQSAAAVAATVVIPAGAQQTTFVINLPNNSSLTGPRTATISAAAAGYGSGAATLTVLDDEHIASFHNAAARSNVDGQGAVDAQDILFVIFELDARQYSNSDGLLTGFAPAQRLYLDVNADGYIDAQDVLFAVLDYGNDGHGEGEAAAEEDVTPAITASPAADLMWLAIDAAEARRRERDSL